MVSIENTNFLRDRFRSIYDKFRNHIQSGNSGVELLQSVSGYPTVLVNGICLHSRYDPVDEGDIILKEYRNVIKAYNHILFFGVGLGYIVDSFVNQYPNKEFSIYEPIDDIFDMYISNRSIVYKNLKNICIGSNKDNLNDFLNSVLQQTEQGVLLVYMPSYRRLFKQQYDDFNYEFNLAVKRRRSLLATNSSFQKDWIINSVENFEYTLNTPDIFMENPDRFKGKVGIIVSAGASLDFEIENLKYIKQNNMAFIFSVSSATNSLLKNGIKPHAAVSYDPGIGNMMGVFEKIIDEDMDDFPLIYGSSIYGEIVQNYKGPMIHMITEQDTISKYYLKNKDGRTYETVSDAPSIAVLALEMLYKLGCSKIILVGQNLSYYKGQYYGSDMDKERNLNIDLNSPSIVKVKDVYGNDVESSITFIAAKEQMEAYVQRLKNEIEVINTTKYGANIEGTEFMDLDKVIENDLKKDDIDTNFFEYEITDCDIEYLKNQNQKMNQSKKQYESIVRDIEKTLSKTVTLARNRNFNQLERSYNALNNLYEKLISNDFFNVFVYPINRVSWQYFSDQINMLSPNTSALKRADTIINEYKRFIFVCKKSVREIIDDLYNDLQRQIEENIGELRGGYKIFEAEIIIENDIA